MMSCFLCGKYDNHVGGDLCPSGEIREREMADYAMIQIRKKREELRGELGFVRDWRRKSRVARNMGIR